MRKNKLQLFILKVFRHQHTPMLVFQERNNPTNKILFGGLNEPSARYLHFYRINPFEDGNTHFFTRSEVEHLNGFCEVALQGVSRNKYLGITLFGPSGICSFIERLQRLIGARALLFAGYDILDQQYKLGIKQQHQFTSMVRSRDGKFNTTEQVNRYLRDSSKTAELQDPRRMVQEDGGIRRNSFTVYPIRMGSHNALSYLVVGSAGFKWNHQLLTQDRFPLALIPELEKQGEFRWQNKTFISSDYKINGHPLLYLVLDIRIEEIASFEIQKLIQNLQKQKNEDKNDNFLIIIHLAQKETLMHEQYESFIGRLECEVSGMPISHLITDDTFYHNDKSVSFERDKVIFQHLQFTRRLNSIMPTMFPMPPVDLANEKAQPDQINIDQLWPSILSSKLLYRKTYTLEADGGEITFEKTYKIGPSTFILTQDEINNLQKSYDALQKLNLPLGRIELSILGTAASVPTLANNVQSFCLSVQSYKLLLDCGSNTFYQLYCTYGQQNISQTLLQIQIILISHFHTDHHLGLITLLSQRFRLLGTQALAEPICIIIPQNLFDWYNCQITLLVGQFFSKHSLSDACRLITHKEFMDQQTTNAQYALKGINAMGLKLEVFPVFHCFYSAGAKVTDTVSGETIVFSFDRDGRNMANDRVFVEKAQGCDVLVHEATFSDRQASRAMEVNHSTLTQAVLTGMQVGARNLVLTHFTSECKRQISEMIDRGGQLNRDVYRECMREFVSDGKQSSKAIMDYVDQNTVFTQDLMTMNIKQIMHLPALSRLIIKYSPYM